MQERLCHIENGMVSWHPHGWTVFRLLEDAVREHTRRGGYREVRTPQLMRREIWETSGHAQAFADHMFWIDGAALKPVSCPGHVAIVQKLVPSWRDLPIRLSELGLVHRDEPPDALSGLFRLRQFTQDDGHIFCADDQVAGEVARFCRELPAFYQQFGFADVHVALSLRPANRLGDDAWWDRAERELARVVEELGLPYVVQPGDGAIYGPKLEFILRDSRGRPWQCGTIQLDFVMPQRFDVRYVDKGGEKRHCVMLHRALFGSIERFLAILVDHGLPPWLAPEQVAVLPVKPEHADRAREVAAHLPLRSRIDLDGTLSRRVRAAHDEGIPFAVIVGEREVTEGTLSVRAGDQQWSGPAGQVITQLADRCMQRA
jgi:threonyl-tRNA synthetase